MKVQNMLFAASMLMISMISWAHEQQVEIDSMVDFRYPISVFEVIHTDLAQVLYKLEGRMHHRTGKVSDIFEQSIQTLCQIEEALETRHNIKPEDVEFLQNMIDRIDSLIAYLEEDDPSRAAVLRQMCTTLKDKF